MNIKKKQGEKGFTIIEVVLVLAIAGLIFMMVFLALPALQRSQRDTQRKNDLSRAVTAIENYTSSNNGALPTNWSGTGTGTFQTQYLTISGDSFADPSVGTYTWLQSAKTGDNTSITAVGTIYYTTGATCNGSNGLTTGQGARRVALRIKLESGGTYCVNN